MHSQVRMMLLAKAHKDIGSLRIDFYFGIGPRNILTLEAIGRSSKTLDFARGHFCEVC